MLLLCFVPWIPQQFAVHLWGPAAAGVLMHGSTCNSTVAAAIAVPIQGGFKDAMQQQAANLVGLALQMDAFVLRSLLDKNSNAWCTAVLVKDAPLDSELAVAQVQTYICAPALWHVVTGSSHAIVSAMQLAAVAHCSC
eukprot:jgi/Chrzof1/8612/Cz03g17110.t1